MTRPLHDAKSRLHKAKNHVEKAKEAAGQRLSANIANVGPPETPMTLYPPAPDATALLPRLRDGRLTVESLARQCLARIEARERDVLAWAHLDPAHVLAQARALDQLDPAQRGPLHGLPIGIKDIILTRDAPTQYNSPIYAGHWPRLDAACVALLRGAGALVFGKTATVELAGTGRSAPTRNPHDLQRTPGGSSSGSAAAVADGHVPLALGTQTGGSIIRPASYCGVYALKPTWNLVSREGVKTFSLSLDTVGWFARSAADLALLLDVLDPDGGAPQPLKPLDLSSARIAVCHTAAWPNAEAATREALAAAAAALLQAGAHIEPLVLPPAFDDLVALQRLVMRTEARGSLLAEYRSRPGDLHPSLREQVENTDGTTREQLLAALDTGAQCRAAFDALAAGYDAVLTPSTVAEAPVGLAATGPMTFNALWSLLQVPCVNVPGLRAASGMPVGVTLTGPRFRDRQVLEAAAALGRLLR